MIKVVIADDHAIVRGGLKQIFALSGDIEFSAEASNGGELLELLRLNAYDLLLLDINMPGISGFDLISRVKAYQPTLPILILSMHNEVQIAVRVLKSGAAGYITKGSDPSELLSAIRKIANRGKYIDPEIAEKLVFAHAFSDSKPAHDGLTDRELQILKLLISGMSVNEIGRQLNISAKTVSTHKTRMMEKLNITNMADLMRYAMLNELL